MKKYFIILSLFAFFSEIAFSGTITGTVFAKRKKHIENSIVYIENISGKFKTPKKHVVMDQKNLTFIPHVLPIIVGTTVDFLNSDNIRHNVFSPDNEKYNLGTWPKGEAKSYKYDKPGIYTQLCNVHPEMEAYIVVLQNPYFAKMDKTGNFKIKNIPNGEYILKVWNKKLKADPQKIKIEKDKTLNVNFKLQR